LKYIFNVNHIYEIKKVPNITNIYLEYLKSFIHGPKEYNRIYIEYSGWNKNFKTIISNTTLTNLNEKLKILEKKEYIELNDNLVGVLHNNDNISELFNNFIYCNTNITLGDIISINKINQDDSISIITMNKTGMDIHDLIIAKYLDKNITDIIKFE